MAVPPFALSSAIWFYL